MEDGSDVPGLRPTRQDVAMPRHVEDKRYVQVPHVPCHAHDHVPPLGRRVGKHLKCIPRPVWAEFFQFAKGTSSVDAIVESMAFMLENAHYWEGVQEVGGEYHHGGGFLPLGVWKTLGFEAAYIKKKSLPEDVKEHHELGKLYRVPLLVNGTLIGPIGPNTFKRR